MVWHGAGTVVIVTVITNVVWCAGFEVNGSAKDERVGIITLGSGFSNTGTKSDDVLICAGSIGGENIGTTASGGNRLVVGAVVGTEAVAVAGVIRGDSGGALGDGEGRDS